MKTLKLQGIQPPDYGQAIEQLQGAIVVMNQLAEQLSKTAAPVGVSIDSRASGGSELVRLRSSKARWGGKKSKALGPRDGPEHRQWQERIEARQQLEEIRRRIKAAQALCKPL